MTLRRTLAVACLPIALTVLPACQSTKAVSASSAEGTKNLASETGAELCGHFNRAAVRLNLPLYWTADTNGDGTPNPEELVELLFYPTSGRHLGKGASNAELAQALERISATTDEAGSLENLSTEERARRSAVIRELDQGQPALVHTDLSSLADAEKAFVQQMLAAAHLIDALYAVQTGMQPFEDKVSSLDPESQSLFRRNWGPKCLAPMTQNDPNCWALPTREPFKVGVYPLDLQDADAAFCKQMEADPKLADPFTVVVRRGQSAEALSAVPYTEAWSDAMKSVATHLRAAADAIDAIESESALRAYLRAAATAFETNDWKPADEAWAAMNGRNSRWYVRVGPDETYWEPCSLKAGIHLTFARINPASIDWQDKLTPRRQKMEDDLAELIGAPYASRQVSFQLPDFIDIVFNAGDDRDPFGATIGQSLPNWGPVANEGRGRTVAMSNLYTDPVSLKNRRSGAQSLLTAQTMAHYTDSPNPGLISTILHEAAHNLGPSHEYEVDGKIDTDVFGGPLASIAEELKAQSAALWFIDFLAREELFTPKEVAESYLDSIVWAFGHVSRGMFDGTGRPKTYSQLAAIQLGFLMDEGALSFEPEAMAANGTDKGAFTVHFDKLAPAAEKLMKLTGSLKAQGDRAALEALIDRYVKGSVVPHEVIVERLLRHPKASFVYGLTW